MKETIELFIVLIFFTVGIVTVGLLFNAPLMIAGGILIFIFTSISFFKNPEY